MTPFPDDGFFLESDAAVRLFEEHAKSCPIYDYHCHLPAQQIRADHRFANLTEVWLDGDHYKWRAMRAHGVPEDLITGDRDPYDRFCAWVETVPYTLRNPLYLWSHLELRRYFGIELPIEPANAERIWNEANAQLAELSIPSIFEKFKVAVVCTTDDPADSLQYHADLAKQPARTRIYPAFRPDAVFAIDQPEAFRNWLDRLGEESGSENSSFGELLAALRTRHGAFHALGCRLSDHGVDQLTGPPMVREDAERLFDRILEGHAATKQERAAWTIKLLLAFGRWDAEAGWTKQLHLGALRNTNRRAFATLGRDAGYDSIGDFRHSEGLMDLLDTLDSEGRLPQLVIYNVNPSDNFVFATMAGNYNEAGKPGKVQFGSAWWYLDQKEGIELQLNALSNAGLLRHFVGMLTDSRSFMSYPRHEYFRRVLCNLLAKDMEHGVLPRDFELVGQMVKGICFDNAARFFGLEMN